MQIIIVVHANSEWNERGLWQGQCDTRLSTTGARMARQLAMRDDLTGVRRIYSSDLQRAMDTAGPLAERLGIPVTLDSGLREGRWVDHAHDPQIPLLDANYGYETREALAVRAAGTLAGIAAGCTEFPAMVVTHGTFLECFLASHFHMDGEGSRMVRTALNRFNYRDGIWLIDRLNDYSHLPALEPDMICVTANQGNIREHTALP